MEQIKKITEQEREKIVTDLRAWITEHEGPVKVEMGEMMGSPMLMFKVNDSCKYGFTHGRYLTFHNWVMYCNPEIREKFAAKLGVPKSRIQKSCINLSPADSLNEQAFSGMFKAGAEVPWADLVSA